MLTTGAYYCGPAFLGPCHPLPVWDPNGTVPDVFKGNLYYLAEAEASGTDISKRSKDDLTLTSTRQRARDAAAAGHDLLAKIDPSKHPDHVRDEIAEQQAMGEYLYRTFRATVNTIRFVRLIEEAHSDRKSIRPALLEIARDELANTAAALTMYERAPWLSHHLRLDVGMPPSVEMVREKIRLLEKYLADGNL